MCICVCISANNMQILGFGGVGGVRSGGGVTIGGEGVRENNWVYVIIQFVDNLSEHQKCIKLF